MGAPLHCYTGKGGPEGVGYGMEMDSYKPRILDGVLNVSGTKTKLY
jgi:hypothetical protein